MRLLSWVFASFLCLPLLHSKTFLVTFTGYSISPSGEPCGGQDTFGEDVSFPGTGMTEIIQRLRPQKPLSELEMRAFTYFNAGFGLACTAPFDGEADHRSAEEFLRGKVLATDFVIVAGHSYGAHRALLFAEQFRRNFGRSVNALVLADAIDWTVCSVRSILSGGRLSDCRQNDLTVELSPVVLGHSFIWNYRQERGVRIFFFTLPLVMGYNVAVNGLAANTYVLNTTHTDVDNNAGLQSLIERLALTGSSSVSNAAEAVGETISQ